ncbi:MAG: amidase domain-containing protein [Peptococcaceae bacterium]|nr:amidase domain-containing protein [Peptococcaceae bacterium]
MLISVPYNREQALAYANKWALHYNPRYYNFAKIGGDCTNFASQILYAGCGVMNHDPYGWYYANVNRRSASWCSVEYLYKFLINNRGCGPMGEEVDLRDIQCGDLVQLSLKGQRFEHCPVVVGVQGPRSLASIFVASHTRDVYYEPLSNYKWADIRFVHITGAKK